MVIISRNYTLIIFIFLYIIYDARECRTDNGTGLTNQFVWAGRLMEPDGCGGPQSYAWLGNRCRAAPSLAVLSSERRKRSGAWAEPGPGSGFHFQAAPQNSPGFHFF